MYTKQNKPVFEKIVPIGVAGEAPGLLAMKFRGDIKRSHFNAMTAKVRAGETSETDMLSEVIAGWDEKAEGSLVDVPYSREALDDLLDTFWGAGSDIVTAYIRGRSEAKSGN